jgi:hypothetical protein
MYLNKTAQELVFQVDSVFCDTAIFYLSPTQTLDVTMSRFGASGGDGCDTVKWRTESEQENLGYRVYRRIKPAFIDSLTRAADTLAQDSVLDAPALLFKRKAIATADTGWRLLNEKIIPSRAPQGASVGPLDYRYLDFNNVYNEFLYEYRLVAVDYHNKNALYGPAEARPLGRVPVKFALIGNYPNPFRRATTIRFDLPVKTMVSLDIYNLQGKLVRRLIKPDKKYPVGYHKVAWDGLSESGFRVASGTYIYRLSAGKFAKAKIMMLIR